MGCKGEEMGTFGQRLFKILLKVSRASFEYLAIYI
jgi:hypothetical protein